MTAMNMDRNAQFPSGSPSRSDRPRPAPRDLRDEASAALLVDLVLDAVSTLDLPRSGLPRHFPNPEGLSPVTLMSFVTYAYAIGCQDSEEIEETARTDRTLSSLSASQLPSSPTIRRFRRCFQTPIRQVLAAVLRRWARQTGFPLADQDCVAEARHRLEAAILADTIALDY